MVLIPFSLHSGLQVQHDPSRKKEGKRRERIFFNRYVWNDEMMAGHTKDYGSDFPGNWKLRKLLLLSREEVMTKLPSGMLMFANQPSLRGILSVSRP